MWTHLVSTMQPRSNQHLKIEKSTVASKWEGEVSHKQMVLSVSILSGGPIWHCSTSLPIQEGKPQSYFFLEWKTISLYKQQTIHVTSTVNCYWEKAQALIIPPGQDKPCVF